MARDISIVDQPLKPTKPTGFKGLIVYLNIAEAGIRTYIPHQRLQVTDLSGTFNDGYQAVFKGGKLRGWVTKAVF